MKARLTRRYVEALALAPGEGARTILDATLPGFGIRVRPGGAKTYVLRYRVKGAGRAAHQRTLTIGRHPQVALEDARSIAQQALGEVAAGNDPARERFLRDERTVGDVLDAYLATLEGRASYRVSEPDVRLHLKPAFGRKRAEELARQDVEELKRKLEREGKRRRAAACVVLLRTALRRAGLDDGPARVKVSTWRKRERAASPEELGRILLACRDLLEEGAVWEWAVHLFLLLILTGARPAEIRTARWGDVDLGAATITRKEHKTAEKTGSPRTIHLPPEAVALIRAIPRLGANPHLIPGRHAGQPLKVYDKPWRAIAERAGVSGLWVYDLRRTWASMALGAGASREQIARALGHSDLTAVSGYAWLLERDRAAIGARVASEVARLGPPPTPPGPTGGRGPSGRA